jgi:hypothetical protein
MIDVSVGEVIDKYTILCIKHERISDSSKLENIHKELEVISNCLFAKNYFTIFSDEISNLKSINEKLWVVEDEIRTKESKLEFDDEFIKLARSVYVVNDMRFDIKNKINKLSNSDIMEEKSYAKYS